MTDPAPEYLESDNYIIYDRQNTQTFVMTCFSEKQMNDYMSILRIHCQSLFAENPTKQNELKKAFQNLGIKKNPASKEVRQFFRIMVE